MKVGDKCIQRSLVFYNILCFIIGVVILSIGIWTAVDRIFLSDIIGTYLYSAASYLVISTGAVILIVAFIGGFGACMRMRFLLIVYFGLLLVLFLCLVIASILAVVFRGEIENTMKSSMRDTLINMYGTDIHSNSDNAAVTRSWDQTQWRFECCAVDDTMDWDYRVYRQSNWFTQTQAPQPGELHRFVPESCCTQISVRGNLQYKNVDACQKPLLPIPPKGDSSFGENDAFNKEGCFSKGYDLVMEQAGIILAVGFTFAFALILGMVLAICFYRNIPSPEAVPDRDRDNDSL